MGKKIPGKRSDAAGQERNTTMTQQHYTKALERAKAAGLTICAKGFWKEDGSRVVGVS